MRGILTYEEESRLIAVSAFCSSVPTYVPHRIGAAGAGRGKANSEGA
jgi:hypothetical protein